jgi:hypothetical protein
MVIRALLLASVVIALSPSQAEACSCDIVRYASPVEEVPVRGTLYFTDQLVDVIEKRGPPSVRWFAGSGAFTLTRISPITTRIDYVGVAGSVLSVELYSYRLTSEWRRPDRAPRILDQTHYADSESDSIAFELDQPVAAIRVQWTHHDTRAEWTVVQGSWKNILVLGDLACGAPLGMPEELWDGGRLDLTAIHVDGTEMKMDMPFFFSSAFMRQEISDTPPTYTGLPPARPPIDALGVDVREPSFDFDHRDRPTKSHWLAFASLVFLVAAAFATTKVCDNRAR